MITGAIFSENYIQLISKFSFSCLFLALFYKISDSWKRLSNVLTFRNVRSIFSTFVSEMKS